MNTLNTEHGTIIARAGKTMQGNECLRVSFRVARKLGTRDHTRLPVVEGYGNWIGDMDRKEYVAYRK